MSEKRFEKDCDENVCSFDYSTMDTYYEYNVSNEEIIEWNKHSSNAEYTDLERITEILNIKQMRLESLMKHREEVGKLFVRIDEQQATIQSLKEENGKLRMKIVSLENEIQRQNNEVKNTRKEFIKKTDELNWLKSEDYLKKIY